MTHRPGHNSKERFAEFLERFHDGYYSRERMTEDSPDGDGKPEQAQDKGEKKQRRRSYLKLYT
ncbi:MAG: hypothetical protein ACR2NP_17340, partial [Pirellulaceae bacterium]